MNVKSYTPVSSTVKMPTFTQPQAHQKQHHADADVGEHDAHPDLIGQGVQEGEDPRLGLLGLLDHDGDAQGHEGLGEVDHLLAHQGDGQGGHGDVGSLGTQER